jgi:hypothetical protein
VSAVAVNLSLAYWISLLIGVGIPVLVGLATTRVTHNGVKAVLLLLLSGLNGLLTEFADAGTPAAYDWGSADTLAGVSFAIGVLTHFGLYKPTGLSARLAETGVKAPPALPRE